MGKYNKYIIYLKGFTKRDNVFFVFLYVGNHLMKTVVFNTNIEDNEIKAVFQGLKQDEQPARKNDKYIEEVVTGNLVPAHTRLRPILRFTERDILDTTLHFKIQFCPLYKQDYRSLGARTTSVKTTAIPAWEQCLDHTEEKAGRRQDEEKTMDRLRKLEYM